MKDIISSDKEKMENALREFNKKADITTLQSSLCLLSATNLLISFIKRENMDEKLYDYTKKLDVSVIPSFAYTLSLTNFMIEKMESKE